MTLLEQPFVQGVLVGFATGVGATATVLFLANRLVQKFPLMPLLPINDAELLGKDAVPKR